MQSTGAGVQLAPGFVEVSATDYGVLILGDPIGNASGWWTFNPFRFAGDVLGTSINQTGVLATAGLTLNIAATCPICFHRKSMLQAVCRFTFPAGSMLMGSAEFPRFVCLKRWPAAFRWFVPPGMMKNISSIQGRIIS